MIIDRTDAAIDRLTVGVADKVEPDLYTVGRSLVLEIAIRSRFGARMPTGRGNSLERAAMSRRCARRAMISVSSIWASAKPAAQLADRVIRL